MTVTLLSSSKSFEGEVRRYSHKSKILSCDMKFHIFVPPTALHNSKKSPVLWFLSGITSTDENFITKSGAVRFASKENLFLVCPDTSPRGCNIPGEDDSWDLGSGSGFYLDATQEPWSKNYRMYSYVTVELFNLINQEFSQLVETSKHSIFGHSMGGHGALIASLKNPGKYKSVSCFAPICNPIKSNLGSKNFNAYLGSYEENKSSWESYDATYLLKSYNSEFKYEILIDQGTGDEFLKTDLLLNNLTEINNPNITLNVRMRDGYPHNYFFISTFIEDHILHHSKVLNQ